jgi:hypothetical protein
VHSTQVCSPASSRSHFQAGAAGPGAALGLGSQQGVGEGMWCLFLGESRDWGPHLQTWAIMSFRDSLATEGCHGMCQRIGDAMGDTGIQE